MSWFKVDDGFHCHPKVLEAGNTAAGFYIRCGSWVSQQLTDGFVPRSIALLYGDRELADLLVEVKMWLPVDGGWQMHDYLIYNRSRVEVQADRAAAAERQKRAREKAKAARDAKQEESDSHADSHGVTAPVSHADVTPVVTVPPTRPDPIKKKDLSSRLEPRREDVHDLCKHLQDRLIANGCKAPTAAEAEGWRREARLMLDKDERDLAQAHQLIDWCTSHDFWQSKVLGMPKFRKQYDQLRLQAQSEAGLRHLNSVPAGQPHLRTFEDYVEHHAAKEAARLIRKPYVPQPQPPSDKTKPEVWAQQQADRWLTDNADAIRAALTHEESA